MKKYGVCSKCKREMLQIVRNTLLHVNKEFVLVYHSDGKGRRCEGSLSEPECIIVSPSERSVIHDMSIGNSC